MDFNNYDVNTNLYVTAINFMSEKRVKALKSRTINTFQK